MSFDTKQIKQWKTWRIVEADDSPLLTVFKPSDYDPLRSMQVHPWTAIAVRAWGQDANNETAAAVISGWMGGEGTGRGPGQVLWDGALVLGSIETDEVPLTDKNDTWSNFTGNWFEVDTWDPSGGSNAAGAVVASGGDQAVLVIRTLGYVALMLELTIGTAATIGVAWRPIETAGLADLS